MRTFLALFMSAMLLTSVSAQAETTKLTIDGSKGKLAAVIQFPCQRRKRTARCQGPVNSKCVHFPFPPEPKSVRFPLIHMINAWHWFCNI